MRIIRFLLTSFVVIAIIASIAALLTREFLLIWGTSRISASISELQLLSKNSGDYARQCKLKGSPPTDNVIDKLQLRFLDSKNYVTEVVCAQFPLDPIMIKQDSLPLFVTKSPGSTGIIWGNDRSGVDVQVFGRHSTVVVQNNESNILPPAAQQFDTMPQSTCSGYGYTCCQPDTQQGVGNVDDQATDCPRTCFNTCAARPIVLSFVSDPFPDPGSRSIQVQSGESVTFSYVLSSGLPNSTETSAPLTGVLDYGDGQTEQISQYKSQPTHVYTCLRTNCVFVASVSVKNAQGVASADTPNTSLTVNVSR